jgi:hypothetical protein
MKYLSTRYCEQSETLLDGISYLLSAILSTITVTKQKAQFLS